MKKTIPTITIRLPVDVLSLIKKRAWEQAESENKTLNKMVKTFLSSNKPCETCNAEKLFRTLTNLKGIKTIKLTRDNYKRLLSHCDLCYGFMGEKISPSSLTRAAIMQEIVPKSVQSLVFYPKRRGSPRSGLKQNMRGFCYK